MTLERWFGLEGKVAVVTGGTGALGSAMAAGLAAAGARVAVMGRSAERAEATAREIGGEALPADVLRREELEAARDRIGRVDVLVNAAGGNVPGATLAEGQSVFDLPDAAFREVLDLNLLGSLLPAQVFGRAITRVVGYAAAKAAIESLTRWLAVELAPAVRVNAIAPGFFVGEQNRRLLLDERGEPTERGRTIVAHTPAGRFGEADELVSTLLWLCGPGASFVTGTVVPVDGGFSAFSGV